MRAVGVTAVGSPFAVALPSGVMPWPAELALALSGPVAFMLTQFWTYRLSCRAMERAASDDVTEVLAVGTGQPATPRQQRRRPG